MNFVNSFNVLDNYENEQIDRDDVNKIRANKKANKDTAYNTAIKAKGSMYVNTFPERNISPRKKEHKNNATKTVIISDSITKRINMIKLNKALKNGNALKRVFPGATASQLNYYVEASLSEDKPDTIIICAGTNNITKKKQCAQETAKEIINISETCRSGGVKKVFISSLTCRQSSQREVNEVNKLLQYYAGNL